MGEVDWTAGLDFAVLDRCDIPVVMPVFAWVDFIRWCVAWDFAAVPVSPETPGVDCGSFCADAMAVVARNDATARAETVSLDRMEVSSAR